MTNDESAMMEAQAGNLPTRTATYPAVKEWFKANDKAQIDAANLEAFVFDTAAPGTLKRDSRLSCVRSGGTSSVVPRCALL